MDKRKPHLSSQILSGEITREHALTELQTPLYEAGELSEDKVYVAKKLGLRLEELEQLVGSVGRDYAEYANWDSRYAFMQSVRVLVQKVLGRSVKSYS